MLRETISESAQHFRNIYIFLLSHVKREKGLLLQCHALLLPPSLSFFLSLSLSLVCVSTLVSARCFVPVVCVSCLKRDEKRERQKRRRRCAVQTPHLHVTPIPNFSLPPTDADDNDDAKRRRLVCAQPTTLPILFTLSYRWLAALSALLLSRSWTHQSASPLPD